jgi:hypothetical protein
MGGVEVAPIAFKSLLAVTLTPSTLVVAIEDAPPELDTNSACRFVAISIANAPRTSYLTTRVKGPQETLPPDSAMLSAS